MATAIWKPANDPTIYGTLDVDATAALAYVRELNDGGGPHVTVTHLVSKALANTLAEHPECNAYVRRGRTFQRDDVDVFVLVAVPPSGQEREHDAGADLTGVKIEQADRKSVVEIAAETAARAERIRRGKDRDFGRIKGMLDRVPPALLSLGVKLITFAQYDLNLDLSGVGVPRDSFGAAFVTSVGMLGIGHAFAPIVPMTRISVLAAVGRVEDKALVVDGRVEARPVLPITATFDHRVIDGFQAGRLADSFTRILRDPKAELDD